MTWAHKARGSEGGEPDETGFPREGYQLGDLAGAVSLAIPMEVYEAEARERTMANVSLFGALAAVIVLRKEATVKSLDVMVPIMAGCYFVMTLWIILTHLPQLPGVFVRIFSEALGLRQAVGGGFGAVVMNGIKRGLFSNEAGSGSAPCAAAAAEDHQFRFRRLGGARGGWEPSRQGRTAAGVGCVH